MTGMPSDRASETWPGRSWYEFSAPGVGALPRLTDHQRCRLAIIGGGLAGLSLALSLAERGVDGICLLEAAQPGHGASGRNGGFVFAGYSLGNEQLIAQVGVDRARLLHGWTRESVGLIRQRVGSLKIDCQLNPAGVLLADWFDDAAGLLAQADSLRATLGFELDFIDQTRMDDYVRSARYSCGLLEPGSFHFHPLRYLQGLVAALAARGVQVFAESPVVELTHHQASWLLQTPAGSMQADQVVLATGGYDQQLYRPVQRALQPVATYVAVTEPLGASLTAVLPSPVAVYDTRFAFDYYRPLPDQRLLWGGRISMAGRSPAVIRRLLKRDLARVFPSLGELDFAMAWGGWMSYATHQMPLLGRRADGLWYALAFGGHGMATTTLAGEVLADAISGQDASRIKQFRRWPARWAGGALGRAGTQFVYWGLQARDQLRSLRKKFRT